MMFCNNKFKNLFHDFRCRIRNRQVIDDERTLPRMRNLTTTSLA